MSRTMPDECYICGLPEDYDNPLRYDTAGVPVCDRGCKGPPLPLEDAEGGASC